MTPPQSTLHPSISLRVAQNFRGDDDAIFAALKRQLDHSWNEVAIEYHQDAGYAAAISLGYGRLLRLPFDLPATLVVVTNVVMAATAVLLNELAHWHAAARQSPAMSLEIGLSLLMARLDVAAIEQALLDVYLAAESMNEHSFDHTADTIGTRLDAVQSGRSLFDRELRLRADDLAQSSQATEIAWWRSAFLATRAAEPLPWWLDEDLINRAADRTVFDDDHSVSETS